MTASSKQLGKLHELITKVLTQEVEECIEPQQVLVGMDPETDEPQYEMQRKPLAPAMAGQIINFLKNNNISAGTEDDELKKLEEKLKQSARPARPGVLAPVSEDDARWQAGNPLTQH